MVTRLIILLALIAVLVGGCVWQEQRVSTAQRERKQALDAKAAAIAERDSARASTKTVVTQYVDRVQIVREAGATITREIPIYVTQKADAACAIPAGFVRLHDAAATGNPAGPSTGDPDAPAAGITLSGIAGTVADNYTSCHATAAQLSALQDGIDLHAPESAP
ncbi:hypothetical protein ABQZ69_19645 [Xanthomonas sp. WHRI 8391]|uniref:Lipoprotein n=1 Tax=Xanthomonas hortorum pv. carotae TaxID=487904 RepID=A0A6V7CC49_9XANT|nr:hypothetical protein [Xanthomonas hortorum]MBG3852659.1 hypothetical protein [Xanthomonas hortorum pv. carotae]UTS73502.1 hypothetical protein NMB96_01140 [Xanthomonas hortorum]CAD0313890.1 hypothetical protein CFBP7900_09450 [Xanthomonas hortorum pv. carotae]CAD0313897.1 hypothetical protein CFBP7900_09450 [Xanthomonas hortorum pv. carotae]